MDGRTEQIVRRALRGDSAAFSHLIGLYERAALAVAFGCTGDATGAGDIVQEAFLRAWQRIGELKDAKKFGPWLCGIVRHLALDAGRQISRETDAAAEMAAELANGFGKASEASDPADEISQREEGDRVSAALAQLDEVCRTVIVLRYYEGMSSAQIAELIAATPAAVDMRLSRARHTLRRLLQGSTCGAFEDR